MPLPRAAVALFLAVALSLGLSLGISALAQESDPDASDPELGIEWAYQPDSLADLVSESPAIVVAEVTSVRTGQPVALAPDGGDGTTIPTQLIDLQVLNALDGQTPESLTLYQLGGQGLHAQGDPGYAVGERYLLFVEPRHDAAGKLDGTWLPVAPDGRLKKVGSELKPEMSGPVATKLGGATVAEAEQKIEAAAP